MGILPLKLLEDKFLQSSVKNSAVKFFFPRNQENFNETASVFLYKHAPNLQKSEAL